MMGKETYKLAVQVGENITDIIRMPCVQSAHKRSGKDGKVAYYILEPSAMADSEHWQYAYPGDWLLKDGDDKWHVIKDFKITGL